MVTVRSLCSDTPAKGQSKPYAQATPDENESAIARFVDWHGNRYYQWHHYTGRFGQDADWLDAAKKIDEWLVRRPESE